MSQTLFEKSMAYTDKDFAALVERPDQYASQREFVDKLWQTYAPYADSHFQKEIRAAFHQRYWEMYLTCSLKDLGFVVSSKDSGPDVHLSKDGRDCWVEAIAAKAGSGPDAVPEIAYDGVASRVPTDQVVLRLTSAIAEKFRKYEKYVANGIVTPDDPYVIAVNAWGVPHWQSPPNLPRVVSAVLPLGNQFVTINRHTREVVGEGFEHRPEIIKSTGGSVPTTIFQDSKYKGISAVIYSTASIWSIPDLSLGHLTYAVHNPLAKNPIPRGFINVDTEYWVEDDKLFKSK